MATLNLLSPVGYSVSSHCGYCEGRRKAHSATYGMIAPKMTPQFYGSLIDRGWRRSGDYCYRPDIARSCCPQYTIRLEADQFKPSKHQRYTVNRWNKYLRGGEGEEDKKGKGGEKVKAKGKGKGKPFDLDEELRQYRTGGEHVFETYALFEKYQLAVHKDTASRRGFERFLCNSPLSNEDSITYTKEAASHLPRRYGSYHLLYRVDKRLVAISVIDVLPGVISSVYLIRHPDWAWASLGTLSALYEISMVKEMAQAGADMRWLYMGYWIADCEKMRYKGEYAPSFLLDPGTLQFHPLSKTLDDALQKGKGYTPFLEIEHAATETEGEERGEGKRKREGGGVGKPESDTGAGDSSATDEEEEVVDDQGSDEDWDDDEDNNLPTPLPPGFKDPAKIPDSYMDSVVVAAMIGRSRKKVLLPYSQYKQALTPLGRKWAKDLVAAVGEDLMGTVPEGVDHKGILSLD